MSKVSKSPIYESFAMLHPSGDLMCYTNKKRANWYIKLSLAKWINDNTFQLRFEPKGKGKSHLPFYTQKMQNICVVCGVKEQINKHHVVPYVFRSRFPEKYKSNTHHDIVTTCTSCHEQYELHANLLKEKLVKDLGIRMQQDKSKEEKFNNKVLSARYTLSRYLNHELLDKDGNVSTLPEDRLKQLQELAQKTLYEIKDKHQSHWADGVIEGLKTENDFVKFVQMWRQHFLDYAKPQFLPLYWSVKHPLCE